MYTQNPHLLKEMIPANHDLLNFLKGNPIELENDPQKNLVQLLINEIVRVKELLKRSDAVPGHVIQPGATVLNELLSEAYSSLLDYDIVLMKRYYDLLQNCD